MSYGTHAEHSIYASAQPSLAEFKELTRDGFRRIVDLRPPGEERGFDEAREANLQQLEYFCLPIAGAADFTLANVKRFDELLADPAEPKTLVHCGSSNRVGALFALRAAWLKGATAETALALGRSTGLTGLEDAVRTSIAERPSPV